jgi:hypothetical protein
MAKGAGESAEKIVKDVRRRTRRQFSAEEKIRIVLEGLRGAESMRRFVAASCRNLPKDATLLSKPGPLALDREAGRV